MRWHTTENNAEVRRSILGHIHGTASCMSNILTTQYIVYCVASSLDSTSAYLSGLSHVVVEFSIDKFILHKDFKIWINLMLFGGVKNRDAEQRKN